MNIEPFKTPNNLKCTRCGVCKKVCPYKAITTGFGYGKNRENNVESIPFFGDLQKEKRFKLSSRINMWGLDKLKMGFLASVQWGSAEHAPR
jgi:ferredoxin